MGIVDKSKVLISFVMTMSLIASSVVMPKKVTALNDTGDYPWYDATLIRASTYDWGYAACQPAMQAAKTCNAHISTRLGVRYHQSDPWRYDVRNCTSYVAWRVHQENGVDIPGWGNANNWDNAAAKAGYKVVSNPIVGSIAVWEGYFGHVAFVTAVNADGSVNIDQYNKAGTGEFSRQSRVKADHYIYIREESTPQPVTISSPELSSAITSSDATQTPAAASSVVTAQASVPASPSPVTVPPLEPLKPGLLPKKEGVEYQPVLDPTVDEVNVFAVEWSKTASGKIEISKTSSIDGNTNWQKHWQTATPVISGSTCKFVIADANADGFLDLYIFQSGKVASDKQEVLILDGAKEYRVQLGDWPTKEPEVIANGSLSLADYNGDGSLDLYNVKREADSLQVRILDGAAHFAQQLADWKAPTKASERASYVVGDHDGDGRPDIYELGQEVSVFSAKDNYASVIKAWKPEVETTLQ